MLTKVPRDVARSRWFDWFNSLHDLGWPATMSPTELRVVLAIARRVDARSLATYASLRRLQAETRLTRTAFYRGKSEAVEHGLVTRAKIGGKWTIVLASPVPPLPEASQETGRERPGFRDRNVPASGTLLSRIPGRAGGRNPRRMRNSAAGPQVIEAAIEELTEGREREELRYLRAQVPSAHLAPFVASLRGLAVAFEGGAGGAALDAAAVTLSRSLQAGGRTDWFEDRVRAVLADAVAIAHPVVQAAQRIFDGEILDVRDSAPPGKVFPLPGPASRALGPPAPASRASGRAEGRPLGGVRGGESLEPWP